MDSVMEHHVSCDLNYVRTVCTCRRARSHCDFATLTRWLGLLDDNRQRTVWPWSVTYNCWDYESQLSSTVEDESQATVLTAREFIVRGVIQSSAHGLALYVSTANYKLVRFNGQRSNQKDIDPSSPIEIAIRLVTCAEIRRPISESAAQYYV